MEEPIISTTLSGLFIKNEPWEKAHILWFEEREVELKDKGKDLSAINEWRELLKNDPEKEAKGYFKYVDLVMKKLYPEISEEERTRKARESYFKAVVTYIELYPEIINREVVDYFISIKDKFKLSLITTNTKEALEEILEMADLTDLFDIVEYSLPEEKDNKNLVFNRFIEKHGKPILYIGGDRKASYDYCREHNIKCVFANFEDELPIEDVENLNSFEELKAKIEKINFKS